MITLGDLLEEFSERPNGDEDLPVLTLTEHNGFVRQTERFKKRLATEDTSGYKVVRRDDIAFNPYLLWAGAVARNTIVDAGVISPLYPTFRVREGHDPSYIARLLLAPQSVAKYDAIAFGSIPRRRRSSTKDFLAICVPDVPALDEQGQIASFLSVADASRQRSRALDGGLRALQSEIFVSAFGSEPPTGSGGLRFDDLFVDATRHSSKVPATSFLGEGAFPIIDQGVREVAGWWNDESAVTDPGAGLVVFGDHTRRVKFVSSPFVLGADGAKVLRPREGIDPRWAADALAAARIEDLGYSRHMKVVRELRFPNVSLPAQREHARRSRAIDAQRARVRRALALDEELFASLQSRAFSGRL